MKCVNMLICERLYVCMYIFLPLQDLYLYYFPTPSFSLSLFLLFQIDLYCLINDDSIHIYRQTRVVLLDLLLYNKYNIYLLY